MVFTNYVSWSQEVFKEVYFLMTKDLQRKVLGQVSSSTEPEMPVHSFHGLLCWHL